MRTFFVTVYNSKIVTLKKENRNMVVESDRLRLNTGIRGSGLISYTDKQITFFTSSADEYCLYTYDLEKKNLYIMDISDGFVYINSHYLNKNLLIQCKADFDNCSYVYIIPELGIAFKQKNSFVEEEKEYSYNLKNQSYVSYCGDDVAIAVNHRQNKSNPFEQVMVIRNKY